MHRAVGDRLDPHPIVRMLCDMTRQSNTATLTAPKRIAMHALKTTDTADLLTAAYALTHRIHEAERSHDAAGEVSLRTQRDMIGAEIARRTGEL